MLLKQVTTVGRKIIIVNVKLGVFPYILYYDFISVIFKEERRGKHIRLEV